MVQLSSRKRNSRLPLRQQMLPPDRRQYRSTTTDGSVRMNAAMRDVHRVDIGAPYPLQQSRARAGEKHFRFTSSEGTSRLHGFLERHLVHIFQIAPIGLPRHAVTVTGKRPADPR